MLEYILLYFVRDKTEIEDIYCVQARCEQTQLRKFSKNVWHIKRTRRPFVAVAKQENEREDFSDMIFREMKALFLCLFFPPIFCIRESSSAFKHKNKKSFDTQK